MPEVRVIWRGKRLNKRTVAMILEAERICPGAWTFGLMQGSYNTGVSASAGTHDGGGAVDISIISHSAGERNSIQLAMRQVGFAAWIRNPSQGSWPWHLHAIAAGDKDLSSGAAYQVRAYRAGLNGLAGAGRDTGPRGYQNVTWESYKASHHVTPPPPPPPVPVLEISVSAEANILAALKRVEDREAARYPYYVSRFTSIDAKLETLLAEIRGLRSEEKGRYPDLVSRAQVILDEVRSLPKI